MRDIAKKILKQLDEEKISNEPLPLLRSLRDSKEITAVMTLNKAREAVHMLTLAHQMVAPNLTASAALTFAGYGLGQELCERFALEYVVTTKKQDVSLIFLNNKTGDSTKGCVFIFMGNINAPQNLFISQGGSDDTALRKNGIHLQTLIDNNKNTGLFVFPQSGDIGSSSRELARLIEYAEKNNVSHVAAIKSYANTIDFAKSARQVRRNAEFAACYFLYALKSTIMEAPEKDRTKQARNFRPSSRIHIRCPDSSKAYLDRLKTMVGADTLLYRGNELFLPKQWLKQLDEKAIEELSSELKTPVESFKV